MKQYLLPESGQFYKVNMHSHSTYSDGRWTPEEIKKAYNLNFASIYPHYDIKFSAEYMEGVVETLRHVSKLDYAFFNNATYTYNDFENKLVITFPPFITSAIPEELIVPTLIEEIKGLLNINA